MESLRLPPDLIEFLESEQQFEYVPSEAECGLIALKRQNELSLVDFFVDSEGQSFETDDPQRGRKGYYVVQGVDLVAECDGYDPKGILVLLPKLELFGTWDSDHWDIIVFPQVIWNDIVSSPVKYINAQWFPHRVNHAFLVPWPGFTFKEGRPWD